MFYSVKKFLVINLAPKNAFHIKGPSQEPRESKNPVLTVSIIGLFPQGLEPDPEGWAIGNRSCLVLCKWIGLCVNSCWSKEDARMDRKALRTGERLAPSA